MIATAACLVGGGAAQAAASLPCDIYAAGGTPCVAAHSTTRALYGTYNGPLYPRRPVRRRRRP
ncbi:arabinofuranosidase catalytic domain-containing protein [Sphaerisporangium perillae]|uniref:arabinofuranosidase catalytic domain-containing protein n=1 Tax=Sphaerisporangium perillae TaxID=2935860 RepID=UPI00200BE70E|nr:arabinofuranosidase catalytic domain-containing protein [Sphaerisporangium perillae]